MDLHAGTSGFSYDEWRGPFYPAELDPGEMLAFYAARLATVEINNTFYRMPKGELLARWAAAVPPGFRFVLKASRRITHEARLKDAGETVGYLWKSAARLGDALGPILFQLPPFLRKDAARLAGFLEVLPAELRAAFEFRHPSWFDDEIQALLAARGHALAASDEPGATPELVATGAFGYLRLRDEAYSDEALHGWARRIGAMPWREAYVFFKHEDAGAAPRLALRFASLFREATA